MLSCQCRCASDGFARSVCPPVPHITSVLVWRFSIMFVLVRVNVDAGVCAQIARVHFRNCLAASGHFTSSFISLPAAMACRTLLIVISVLALAHVISAQSEAADATPYEQIAGVWRCGIAAEPPDFILLLQCGHDTLRLPWRCAVSHPQLRFLQREYFFCSPCS